MVAILSKIEIGQNLTKIDIGQMSANQFRFWLSFDQNRFWSTNFDFGRLSILVVTYTLDMWNIKLFLLI